MSEGRRSRADSAPDASDGWDDTAGLIAYLRERRVVPDGPLSVELLPGGVSSVVIAVRSPTGGLVVKRARPRLKVVAKWEAKLERSRTEGDALRAMHEVTPNRTPRVIDADHSTATLVLELAPDPTRNWRVILLDEGGNPAVGEDLGRTLASWHRASWSPWERAAAFEDDEAFEQLRLRPFHEAVAARLPEVAEVVTACADELRSERLCFVHGDFSPKNVLVGPELLWIVDFEVARVGHPVFDVAFLACHLSLTAVARPDHRITVRDTWLAFHGAYIAGAPRWTSSQSLSAHVASLLLARTDGVSPEPGLDDGSRDRVRAIARRLFEVRLDHPGAIWAEVERGLD